MRKTGEPIANWYIVCIILHRRPSSIVHHRASVSLNENSRICSCWIGTGWQATMGQHPPHPIPRQIHTPHPRPVVSDSPWWDVRSPGSPFNRLSACSKHWHCFLVTLHILSDSQALTEMSTLLFSMLAARKKGSRQGDTANRQITSLQIALHFLSISYLFPVKPNRIFLWFQIGNPSTNLSQHETASERSATSPKQRSQVVLPHGASHHVRSRSWYFAPKITEPKKDGTLDWIIQV